MIYKNENGIKWLEFELLADCPIVHGSFLRHGGTSHGPLSSLNLGRSVGDSVECFEANLKKVQEVLAVPQLKLARACHGADVYAIDADLEELPLSDGVSTKRKDFGMLVTHADCQAAIFYDPINHAIANVHCGWRGNVQNIYAETVSHMHSCYGSKPENLLVCISPSLGPDNSEFINYKEELPESFWDMEIKPFHFDLWSISERQLKEAGVLGNHIQIARIDTYANVEDYFSYRRSKTDGRQATVCALK